jgi:hypothetical protein
MAKKDGSNLNETNVMSTDAMVPDEAAPFLKPGEPGSGQPALPTLDDYGFSPKGQYFDGTDGKKTGGKQVELTERGEAPGGGHAAAMSALGAIGAAIKETSYQSGLLNVAKGDQGESIEIPSESNLNSANKRVGA